MQQIVNSLKKYASPEKAKLLSGFFKTGPGQYGEGDIFIGITVPNQRLVAKEFQDTPLSEVLKLLKSPIHEHRLTALLILIFQFQKGNEVDKAKIFEKYLKNTKYINNWDLVDLSTPRIVGDFLLTHQGEKNIIYKLVASKDLWERRITVLATYPFIKNNDFKDILKIAKLLMDDKQDLIQKAVGWMLREMGKKNELEIKKFLDIYSKKMPRTMLRYSIEKLTETERKKYMAK